MTYDPHDRLLHKAFGDLDKRPFAWRFDEDVPVLETLYEAPDVNTALAMLDQHLWSINELDEPAAAPQEPRAGETYISSYSELLHAMTNGQLGTPPQPLRRYEPQQPQK